MFESDDGTVTDTSAMHEWGRFYIEGGKRLGQTFEILENDLQEKCMEEAGFVDITTVNKKVNMSTPVSTIHHLTLRSQVPIGGWPANPRVREIGLFVLAALEKDFEGYVLYMASQLLGWTMQEVTVYCSQLRRELRSRDNHPYFRVRIVYGRKP